MGYKTHYRVFQDDSSSSVAPPVLVSAEVPASGDQLILTFDKDMTGTGDDGFILTFSGGLVTYPSNPGYTGTTMTLGLSRLIDINETVTVGYEPGDVVAMDGGVLETFANFSVTNNSEQHVE